MKLRFGNGVADGRGSIGGTTFSRNRYGSYARTRIVPVNPSTDRQRASRSAFRSAALAWKALTDAQRQSWVTYANNTPIIDRLGASVPLAPMQAFMKVYTTVANYNSTLAAFGETFTPIALPTMCLSTAGVQQDDFGQVSVLATVTPQKLEVDLDDDPAWLGANGNYGLLYVGRQTAPTVNFYKAPWKLDFAPWIGNSTSPGNPNNPVTLADQGLTMVLGSRIWLKLVRFSTLTTQYPAERIISAIVTAS